MNILKKIFLPVADKETLAQIDLLNLITIYRTGIIVAAVQSVSLIIYTIMYFLGSPFAQKINPFIYVGSSIVLCLLFYVGVKKLHGKTEYVKNNHNIILTLTTACCAVILLWSIFASVDAYRSGYQILTFYTVELCVLFFIKLPPPITALLSAASFGGCYIYYAGFIDPNGFNVYNYIMFGLIATAGSIFNYRRSVVMISNQNQVKRLNQSLEIVATHDALTRLNNRYALNISIGSFINTDLCIAMLDINDFKSVNDTYGHRAGDALLKTVADVLNDNFPEESLFRYGGDEFLILYRSDNPNSFKSRLKKINSDLKSHPIKGTIKTVSCSFGTIYTKASSSAELMDCISDADKILYEYKLEKH